MLLQGGVQRGGFPLVSTGDYHTACIKRVSYQEEQHLLTLRADCWAESG